MGIGHFMRYKGRAFQGCTLSECEVCLAMFTHIYVVHTYVCVHTYWQYVLSLATGWTWGHEAMAASIQDDRLVSSVN